MQNSNLPMSVVRTSRQTGQHSHLQKQFHVHKICTCAPGVRRRVRAQADHRSSAGMSLLQCGQARMLNRHARQNEGLVIYRIVQAIQAGRSGTHYWIMLTQALQALMVDRLGRLREAQQIGRIVQSSGKTSLMCPSSPGLHLRAISLLAIRQQSRQERHGIRLA